MTPLTEKDIEIYIIVHIILVNRIALGTSTFAFIVSSLIVVMKSNPKKQKNSRLDAFMIPVSPRSLLIIGLKFLE